MKKPSKKALKLLTLSLAVATLVGCSNTNQMKQTAYVEPIYEEKAVFVETYENKHMDVLVGDTKKMYEIPDKLAKKMEKIKPNDIIIIEYSLDNELKKHVKDIRMVGQSKKEDTNQNDTVIADKKEEQKEEKKEEVTISVYREGAWVKEKGTKQTLLEQYEVSVLEGFEIAGNKIISEEDPTYYVAVEELPSDAEIKPQRWRAADELKRIGELKELLNTQIYDPNFQNADFVFTTSAHDVRHTIVVRTEEQHMMRYYMVYPASEQPNQTEASLWAMMESVTSP